jgi:hypothetical protein
MIARRIAMANPRLSLFRDSELPRVVVGRSSWLSLLGMQIPRAIRLFPPASVFFFILRVSAQTPDTAVIRGTVLDQSRAAVAGAEIAVTNHRTGMKNVFETDRVGNFAVAGLPIVGDYDVSVYKEGFAPAPINTVTLNDA